MPKQSYLWLPFGRVFKHRVETLFPDDRDQMQRVADILGVPLMTAYTWSIGNALPGGLERRLSVGVFLGWIEDLDDDLDGIARTLDYFNTKKPGDNSPRSTLDEVAQHTRFREHKDKIALRKRLSRQQTKNKQNRER